MRVIENLDKFLEMKGISDYEITQKSNLSKGLIGKSRRKGNDLGLRSVEKILLSYPELSRVWLLTGEGEMLISTDDKGNLIANNGAVAISGDKATVHLSSSNPSTEIQLLQQRIKHLEELLAEKDTLLAEKERIIQILERITSPQ